MSFSRTTRKRHRTFTPVEITRIIETARRYGANRRGAPDRRQLLATLFTLLANYGPRISEALELGWQDVDFSTGEITLRTLKKKTPSWRTLPLLPILRKELLALRDLDSGTGRVFGTITRAIAHNVFLAVIRKAGLPYATIHDFRHSFLSTLMERTRDVALGRDLVDHCSIEVTDKYIHAIRLREKFLAMGSVYAPSVVPSAPPPAPPPVEFAPPPPPPPDPERNAPPRPVAPMPPTGPAPWGLPWLPGVPLGGGNTITNSPGGAPRGNGVVQARMERLEGAFAMLIRSLAEGLPLRVKSQPQPIREARPPLALAASPMAPPEEAAPAAAQPQEAPPREAPAAETDARAADRGEAEAVTEVETPEEMKGTEFLSLSKLAARTGLSVIWLRSRLRHSRHPLPHFRMRGSGPTGDTIRVRWDEFQAWLETQRADPLAALLQEAPGAVRLRDRLAQFDLDSPTRLASILRVSRQRAHQILGGTYPFGLKVAKALAEATGVPFTQLLEWQEESMRAAENGGDWSEEPEPPEEKPRSLLSEKLAPYGLDNDIKLARALKVQRHQAAVYLRGKAFGRTVARKIARAIGGSVDANDVLRWQDDS
jgi:transcriptional regulator with XRE-family HTH domain